MMISEKYKTIWLIPEGCESDCVTNTLKNFDFKIFEEDVESYPTYTVISNIKNPYYWIYDIYKNKNLKNIVIKKKLINKIIHDFNFWIKLNLINKKFLVESDLKFETVTPNHYVRIENLSTDLPKIDFLKNYEFNDLDNNTEMYYNNLYEVGSAKKVFEYFKKYFYLCGYDPFSFHQEQMSDSEKIKFIHDLF